MSTARQRLREHLAVLQRAVPGERFVAYHAWRAAHDRSGAFGAVGRWVLALLLLVLGTVTLFTPGPGLLFLTLAAALLAQSSRRVAAALDGLEVGVRRLLRGRRKR